MHVRFIHNNSTIINFSLTEFYHILVVSFNTSCKYGKSTLMRMK